MKRFSKFIVKKQPFSKRPNFEKQNIQPKDSCIVHPLFSVDSKEIISPPKKGQLIDARIVDIYDGDTLTVIFEHGNDFIKIKIRIINIDTPEIKVKGIDKNDPESVKIGKLEKDAGLLVRDYVRFLDDRIFKIKFDKWDKYGGRVVGDVFFTYDGIETSLSSHLLENKFAKEYDGKKKSKWTKGELESIGDLAHFNK